MVYKSAEWFMRRLVECLWDYIEGQIDDIGVLKSGVEIAFPYSENAQDTRQ